VPSFKATIYLEARIDLSADAINSKSRAHDRAHGEYRGIFHVDYRLGSTAQALRDILMPLCVYTLACLSPPGETEPFI